MSVSPAIPTARRRPWWTTAAFSAAGIAAVQLGTRAILWFLPYHVAGLVNELVLLAAAAAIGLAIFLIRRRQPSPPPARLAIAAASILYLIASSAGLGWSREAGLGLGVHDYALFSTPGCDFAARFERPPQHGQVKAITSLGGSSGAQRILDVAVLADIATATAFRAECLLLQEGGDMRRTAQSLMTGLGGWASEIGIERRTVDLRDDPRGPVVVIGGEMRGSVLPEQEGRPARTLVGLRSYVGARSVLTVYVFQPQGDALSRQSLAFLDGVRAR